MEFEENASDLSIQTDPSNSASLLTPSEHPIDYKKELVFYFFNKMLNIIVDSYEIYTEVENLESISSSHHFPCEQDEMICMSDESESKNSDKVSDEDATILSQKVSATTNVNKRLQEGKYSQENITDNFPENATDPEISQLSWIIDSGSENVVIEFKNGNKYEGPIFNMIMNGFGKFTWANGTTYVGDFVTGEITGKGELILSDGSRYTGEFLNGYRHGYGTMSIAETYAIYQGNWQAGKKHGKGWQQFAPNSWYNGEWMDDCMHGHGTRQYANTSRYQGEWILGQRNGKGCAVINNTDFYYGDWEKGSRKGSGEYIWNAYYNKTFSVPIQNSYCGEWKEDQMHGLGLINFGMDSGTRYAGYYENNKKHGAGILLCENGSSITSNPLFINDKPVHLTCSGLINASMFKEKPTERKESLFHIVKENINLCNNVKPSLVTHTKLYSMLFPEYSPKIHSLFIPFSTPSEMINIQYYLKRVNQIYIENANYNPEPMINLEDSNSDFIQDTKCKLMNPLKIDQSSLFSINESPRKDHLVTEEKNLRNVITTHLIKLKEIYSRYSQVACIRQLTYDTLLIRLFLWQLFRDCKIPQKGLSLVKIDKLLMENLDTEMERLHCPFEVIYFWQFLHSLVTISVHLYLNEIPFGNKDVLKCCFLKLLENDIYPNYGQHIGCALFTYVDVIPIKAVNIWFESFEQPFTALTFLKNACPIGNSTYSGYCQGHDISEETEILLGINAYPIGRIIAYLQGESTNLQTEPMTKPLKVNEQKTEKLYCFRSLGAKTILNILCQITPNIVIENEIVNMDHEICFLEFYEAVLLCTQELINRQNRKKLKEQLQILKNMSKQKSLKDNFIKKDIKKTKKK